MIKKFLKFNIRLGFEVYNNELYYMGNELTYKIFLSVFPLLIFLIQIIDSLNLDTQTLFFLLEDAIPEQVLIILLEFIDGTSAENNNASIITVSLFLTLISISSGFVSIIRGVNKTYAITKKRKFIKNRILSIFLVLLFTFSITFTMILIIFSENIINFLNTIKILSFDANLLTSSFSYFLLKYSLSFFVVLLTTMIIYKLAVIEKIPFTSTFPGSIFTVIFWLISSSIYNYYINNYSNFSNIYGSIGSMFILVFWINIISIVILVGSQINAIIYKDNLLKNKLNK